MLKKCPNLPYTKKGMVVVRRAGFKDKYHDLWLRLKKYFSGQIFVIQLCAAVGAFVLRTIPAFVFRDSILWSVVFGQIGSYVGYIGVYTIGYWVTFRKDYRTSGRSMRKDIVGLQLAEQVPNISVAAISGLWQAMLINSTGMPTWVGVNVGSWFGPHKIVGLLASLFGSSLKRGCVDHAWEPPSRMRKFLQRLRYLGRVSPAIDCDPDTVEEPSTEGEIVDRESVA
mgnify:CR=1 FL=1